jgi:hypothetical protein
VAVPLISGITAGKCGNGIFKLSGSPGIDSYVAWRSSAGILEQSMGTGNRVGIELSYRDARLHRLTESIPGLLKSIKIPYQYYIPILTRFLAPINVLKFQHRSLTEL